MGTTTLHVGSAALDRSVVDEVCGYLIKHRDGTTSECACNPGHKSNHRDAAYYEGKRDSDRKYRKANGEKLREYFRQYYAQNMDQRREYLRANGKRIRDAHADYYREYRQANAEKLREAKREWRKANPEKRQQAHHKRRAHKRNVPSDNWTKSQVLEKYGRVCWICRYPLDCDWHADHVIPLAKGGWDVIQNVRPAHSFCNLRKNDKLPPVIAQARVWFELNRHLELGE